MPRDDHDQAIPVEVRLSEFILGEGSEEFWVPRPVTPEQTDALCNLAVALRAFERAFGTENTLQQLRLMVATTIAITRKNAATRRILEARIPINEEAAEARARGDEGAARKIEERPTPDYPGKAEDERELGYAV